MGQVVNEAERVTFWFGVPVVVGCHPYQRGLILETIFDNQDLGNETPLVKFEWDETKNQTNLEKHGLLLSEVQAIWKGPVLELESNQSGEPRKLAIGKIGGRFWTVIFTMRGEIVRIISARRSRENEKKLYHEKDHR